ncbi:hypothetical protein [Sphingomonas sp. TREG-RG-20F-R18-01]|uniref:AbrB/MazE/SpoVT family DNA-binding domain-containing protein n=1 Tax=Sphingomonas sp. TREG-RG-20F-R18-01 TaxID=2914982 RepID=UPI001F58CD66|nr:hypothetical protein [Sphingomonas sp. TREG-RG-20F-R18-01]
MRTALRKIGNSVGMIVPASILGEIGATAGATLDLRVEDGKIIATPVAGAHAGWAAVAATLADQTADDADAWQGFANEDDAALTW